MEDVAECARYDTPVCIPFSTARYRECLTGSRLSIRKDRAIVALNAVIDDVPCHCFEDRLLLSQHVKNAVILELVIVIFDFIIAEALPLEIKLNFTFFRLKTQT